MKQKLRKIGLIILPIYAMAFLGNAFAAQPISASSHCEGLTSPDAIEHCENGAKPGEEATKCIKTSFFGCVANKENDSSTENPVYSLLLTIVNFMAAGVGIAVVGGIIWGAMHIVGSNGNAGKTEQGVHIIINAVVGLLLFIFMYAAVNFLVPGGLFK